MGNKLGRKRHMVDDKYTKPQGLYQNNDVNQKKLRKLILDSKLAPCYPGYDDSTTIHDLEECPICFLHYPSLNRSSCCMKGICTECFLQMQPPHSSRPTQCPFCKTSNYAVEYKGIKSKEERGREHLEEQRVIEAKIRVQQKEYQEQEQNMQKRQAVYPSSTLTVPGEVEYRDLSNSSYSVIADEHLGQHASPACRGTSMNNRQDEFDMDLEEIMIMEAISLSMQEHSNSSRDPATTGNASSAPSSSTDNSVIHMVTPGEMPSSSGLAYGDPTTVAANQLVSHGPPNSNDVSSSFSFSTSPHLYCFPTANERLVGDFTQGNWIEASRASDHKHLTDERSGTSYNSGSGVAPGSVPTAGLPSHVGASNIPSQHFLQETFEEQMMLAIALSLANDAHQSQVHMEQSGSSNK